MGDVLICTWGIEHHIYENQGIVQHLRNNNISLNNNGPDDTYIIIYGRKQNKSWSINHKYYSGNHNPMVHSNQIYW